MRRAAVEGLVLDALKSELMQPDLVKEFAASFITETNRLRGEAQAGRSALERERAQVERKLAGLIDAIADGFRATGLQVQLDQLEGGKLDLARQLAEPSRPLPLLHPNLAELYRTKVADLRAALSDPDSRTRSGEVAVVDRARCDRDFAGS